MYHSNRVDPPLGDEYPQADEAFVILNSLSSHTSPRTQDQHYLRSDSEEDVQ